MKIRKPKRNKLLIDFLRNLKYTEWFNKIYQKYEAVSVTTECVDESREMPREWVD